MLPDKHFGSQLCLGYCYLYHLLAMENETEVGFLAPGVIEPRLELTWAWPGDLPVLRGPLHAVGLYLYPGNLLSITKISFQEEYASIIKSKSFWKENRDSDFKACTVFCGALLAGCLGGLFEIMHGDGQRGMISKVVIIMSLGGRDLETAQGAGGTGDEQQLWAPAHPAPSNQRNPSGTKNPQGWPKYSEVSFHPLHLQTM